MVGFAPFGTHYPDRVFDSYFVTVRICKKHKKINSIFAVSMALFLWLTDKTLEWALYDLILGWRR